METFLHMKYVGQKRFSLEGGESLIPVLNELVQLSGDAGGKEVVIGMAHRGRLNVLVNILGKAPAEVFGEFEGNLAPGSNWSQEHGDVKYHQGFSSDINTPGGIVHVALAFNPSHLEIIDAVVQGSVRARQHRRHDNSKKEVTPILVHGDAAFAGAGCGHGDFEYGAHPRFRSRWNNSRYCQQSDWIYHQQQAGCPIHGVLH